MSLLPSNVNSRIDGPLEHDDHERVAVAAELEVLEERRLEQRPARFAQPPLVDGIADVDRQIVVDRALGDALRAFDAEVAHDERLERRQRRRAESSLQRKAPPTAQRERIFMNRTT